jgi:hypothetical protein
VAAAKAILAGWLHARRASRSRCEACYLRGLNPGQRKGHRASAPAQAAERGGLPPVARTASPRFSPIGSAWPLPGGLRD